MSLDATPLAVWKPQPAYTVPPDVASVSTTGALNPAPGTVQPVPLAFHCAMLLAVFPPALKNWPPAYTVLPDTAKAST